MKITRATKDEAIKAHFENEEALLARFDKVRKIANEADAERDRLRGYITANLKSGTYGKAALDIVGPSAPRVYANSNGNAFLEHGFIGEISDVRIPLTDGARYKLLNGDNHVAATVKRVPNAELFTKKGSYTVKTIIGV